MDRDQEFTAFVRARSARLVHFAQMLCGDAGLAEDMARTALEKAYLKWDRIELGGRGRRASGGRSDRLNVTPSPRCVVPQQKLRHERANSVDVTPDRS